MRGLSVCDHGVRSLSLTNVSLPDNTEGLSGTGHQYPKSGFDTAGTWPIGTPFVQGDMSWSILLRGGG